MIANLLPMLIGAGLVAFGVIAGAVADRIRGVRTMRVPAPRKPSIAQGPMTSAQTDMAAKVVVTLVTAGYDKRTAAEAVAACASSECSTIESWTRAALKRCTRREVIA